MSYPILVNPLSKMVYTVEKCPVIISIA